MNQYIAGTNIEMDATFRDANGALFDPSVVTAELRLPDGTVVDLSAEVIRRSIGDYYAPYAPTQNGLHVFRFAGAGLINVAGESNFFCQTQFPGA